MKISWVILTHNRLEFVRKAFLHNRSMTGLPDSMVETVWIDNGSVDGTARLARDMVPSILILNKENEGVARGYNLGMTVARGDFIVITGCDMLMPENWMRTFLEYSTCIRGTACVSMYSVPHDQVPERYLDQGKLITHGTFRYLEGLPMGRKFFPRSALEAVGYLREDFGLYGWEDVEWGYRFARVALEQHQKCWVIDGQIPIHLQNDEKMTCSGFDLKAYTEFKRKQAQDPRSIALMDKCRRLHFPFYTQFF